MQWSLNFLKFISCSKGFQSPFRDNAMAFKNTFPIDCNFPALWPSNIVIWEQCIKSCPTESLKRYKLSVHHIDNKVKHCTISWSYFWGYQGIAYSTCSHAIDVREDSSMSDIHDRERKPRGPYVDSWCMWTSSLYLSAALRWLWYAVLRTGWHNS